MKEVFSAVALLLTFAAFLPYIRTILCGQTRPHVFTWIIWGAGTLVVFLAQLSDGGGVGAWPIGISGLLTIIVAILAMTRAADTSFHRMDWVFLILALTALPLWWVTNTPLYTVLVLTSVDLLGFGPTVRKAYSLPYEDSWTFYAIGTVRNAFRPGTLFMDDSAVPCRCWCRLPVIHQHAPHPPPERSPARARGKLEADSFVHWGCRVIPLFRSPCEGIKRTHCVRPVAGLGRKRRARRPGSRATGPKLRRTTPHPLPRQCLRRQLRGHSPQTLRPPTQSV